MGNEKFLIHVIEDDIDDRFLVEEFLATASNLQYEAEFSHTLKEARQKIQKRRPDVILLDLTLPDAYELEGLHTLIADWPESNIIILTGLSCEKNAAEALDLGASDYLVKGKIDSKLLLKTIKFSLERQWLKEQILRYKKTG